MKGIFKHLVALLIIITAYLFIHRHFENVAASDPDRYFHLALARQGATEGIVRTVPQVEDLGWDKGFIEKNFLFTWLTGRAYALGFEPAVLQLVPVFGICFLALLFITLSSAAPPWLAGWLILIMLLSPDISNRITLLRPHLLAFAMFSLTLLGLLRRQALIAMAGALLFGLSYHANYLVIVVIIGGVAFLKANDKVWLRCLLATTVGLFLGIILNPFFPANILAGANSFKIATNTGGFGPEDRPLEVVPVSTQEFLSLFGPYLALTLIGIVILLRNKSWREKLSPEVGLLLTVTSLFWILSFISRRAIEYAIPTSLIFLAFTYREVLLSPSHKHLRYCLLLLPLVFIWPKGIRFYSHPLLAGVSQTQVMEAVSHLPSTENAKVFNCEWDNGSFILYQKPNLHFVDLSDAILLKNARPELHHARLRLRQGAVAFPYALIKHVFGAKYVLCDHRQIVAQLESDPYFRRIYPKEIPREELRPPGYTVLYELTDTPAKHFANEYDVKKEETWSRADLRPAPNLSPSAYLNLSDANGTPCKEIRISQENLKHYTGASLLGVGGGATIEITHNQIPLARLTSPTRQPRILHTLIPLRPAINSTDSLNIRVCQAKDNPVFGFSASFWKPEEIGRLCLDKTGTNSWNSSNQWKVSSQRMQNCLASVLPEMPALLN